MSGSNRVVLYCALIALLVLGAVQVFWFFRTKQLQTSQFDTRISLILREVADGVLQSQQDKRSEIPPIRQIAANAFLVTMPKQLEYAQLDSVLRQTFARHNMRSAFELAVYGEASTILRGNVYKNFADPHPASCVGRETDDVAATSFSITFPEKDAEVLASMDLWMFTGVSVVFMTVLFGVVVVDLRRQRKLAAMKNEFISNMTHELKSPITNIGMAGQVLRGQHELSDEKRTRYLNIIVEENERLKNQVDQVLLTASFDEADFELLKKPVDLNALIMKVIERFRIRVEQRAGLITTNLRSQNPLISGDETHLTNALLNLLDNAEKYSPEKVQIEVTSQDADEQVVITVKDLGIGISPGAQSLVFDRFYRVGGGNVHDVKGFGLGLSYVKKIIEGHRGFISVNSRAHEGSMFTITLPKA